MRRNLRIKKALSAFWICSMHDGRYIPYSSKRRPPARTTQKRLPDGDSLDHPPCVPSNDDSSQHFFYADHIRFAVSRRRLQVGFTFAAYSGADRQRRQRHLSATESAARNAQA